MNESSIRYLAFYIKAVTKQMLTGLTEVGFQPTVFKVKTVCVGKPTEITKLNCVHVMFRDKCYGTSGTSRAISLQNLGKVIIREDL